MARILGRHPDTFLQELSDIWKDLMPKILIYGRTQTIREYQGFNHSIIFYIYDLSDWKM